MAINNFTNGGGGGTWNTNTNWSLGHIPTATEDVTITGGTAVTLATTLGVCRSLDFTGFTSTFTMSIGLTIGDGTAGAGNVSLKLAAGMTWTRTAGSLTFNSTSATQQTVDFASKSIGATPILFTGTNGIYLFSNLTTSTGVVTLSNGCTVKLGTNCTTQAQWLVNTCNLDLNSFVLSCTIISSISGARTWLNTGGGAGGVTTSGNFTFAGATLNTARRGDGSRRRT
jgi:hypothetical protein